MEVRPLKSDLGLSARDPSPIRLDSNCSCKYYCGCRQVGTARQRNIARAIKKCANSLHNDVRDWVSKVIAAGGIADGEAFNFVLDVQTRLAVLNTWVNDLANEFSDDPENWQPMPDQWGKAE
ncbi:hypothetical protein CLAFUW4_07287 [Fulvia fulva]|uniref:Uncharacterized protein n=1 Tax=Passalora fulva TaxID=5499 RepID=A0A9Q8PBB3_PASFU|nr:uncharacterized protein CLAFUR5_07418 [Fulvia fulva]KAK4621399.1 hypothetical protein CLAFUR4_07295 [Fulvia fulva]KAK4623421.1 hypothetical protein CLAFUR0_07293 [Fulvia fulva]UJO19277.1 hypothetical protein CLAFUR5_07418 [Fulvia fulva]WPV15955.1 hypothetical protein CLAFUW4_07287 [Fulvia fulva]WPV30678.1 hypothetical protein CLAFUW7_07289 [Fulvia fulva]